MLLKFWKRMNILYEQLLMIVLVMVLLIVTWCIYDNYYIYSHTIDDSVLKYKPDQGDNSFGDSPITDEMVAWITIDGTNIDYPVMQGTDNTKYLSTDPYGNYSLSGSIYLDSRNTSDFSDDYSIIYGHHMEFGKMFGQLDLFLDPSYLSEHTTGTLMIGKNAERIYDLQIFAGISASASDEEVFNPLKGGIRQFIIDNSIYTVEDDRRIIALSTCVEGESSARTIVFCYINE